MSIKQESKTSQKSANDRKSIGAPLVFISAGDPSGDSHAAKLVRALEQLSPNARFIGLAGPKTQSTSCDVRLDLTQFSVMMLKNALAKLPTFMRILRQIDRIFDSERPSLVVLVDFPSFNWIVAKKAKKRGIPVVYFMPPQIWGWGQRRVKKMRKYVDLVLSCFQFEHDWFSQRGVNSIFIGHPFFEESRNRQIDEKFVNSLAKRRRLVLLPGSRNQEVANNMDALIKAATLVRQETPDVEPVFAAFKEEHLQIVKSRLAELNLDYPVYVGKTPELMRAATCCLGVSGSVSIELLSLCKPTVITYRVSKLEHIALRFLKRVKYVTLVNILAVDAMEGETPFYPKGKFAKQTEHTSEERALMVFPEFLSWRDQTEKLASALLKWFKDDEALKRKVEELEALKSKVDVVDSPIQKAAEIVNSTFLTGKIDR